MLTQPESVTARAPAKINLVLEVGAPDAEGYHPLVTVFQAVDLWDQVSVAPSDKDTLTVEGDGNLSGVPTDYSNIVWRAVDVLKEHAGVSDRTPLHIHIVKKIPVAGGMAGGSADAAATLVALDQLWGVGAGPEDLHRLARRLGADVPFSLMGGMARGEGRGDILTPLTRSEDLHVVVVKSSASLSTPAVYRQLDQMRGSGELPDRELSVTDTPPMVNDLEAAACALLPELRDVLRSVVKAGATTAMVSGSGPTIWGSCDSAHHAESVAARLRHDGRDAVATKSVSAGTEIVIRPFSPTANY